MNHISMESVAACLIAIYEMLDCLHDSVLHFIAEDQQVLQCFLILVFSNGWSHFKLLLGPQVGQLYSSIM